MATANISKGADGFYHPCSESELVALVKQANRQGVELRVRGSAHSVACAIYTDVCTNEENQANRETPPSGDNINVMLDKYRSMRVLDPKKRLVEAEAGINLGKDPNDPTNTSTRENSLLYQLWHDYGWTLSDLGGVIFQTVSGFISTGSSGGSLTYSINDNIYALRMIDGQGQIYMVCREDSDPETFNAAAVSMGLLGVISTVTFQCVPTFNISGQEAITTLEDASMDLFGDGSNGKPSLVEFLKNVEYTRLEWWPQRGGDRIVTWQCQRIKPQDGFRPRRYQEFTAFPNLAEVFICILYTIIGNVNNLPRAIDILERVFQELGDSNTILKALRDELKKHDLKGANEALDRVLTTIINDGVKATSDWLDVLGKLLKQVLPDLFPYVLDIFIALDSTKLGMNKNEPQSFRDYGWEGLPMDNMASDLLVPVEFTEIWLPLSYTKQVMNLLKEYFEAPNKEEAYARTGYFAYELYAARTDRYWMSMSYSDGQDEWKDGVFRVDIYWYLYNEGNPAEVFYPQFWNLLRDNGIPFRLHWGKFKPIIAAGDPDGWVSFFRSQNAKWDDFLALRAQKDPNNIFLTDYWREHLGLPDVPKPQLQG